MQIDDDARDRWSRAGFVAARYLAANTDVAGDALAHFLHYGARERRNFTMDFDPAALTQADAHEAIAAASYVYVNGTWNRFSYELDRYLPAAWPRIERFVELGARPVVVLGDSHAGLYRRAPNSAEPGRWLLPLVCFFPAGSARGLVNPNSRSGYGRRIHELVAFLKSLPPTQRPPILFKFGQVDTEFVYTFERIKHRRSAFDLDGFITFSKISIQRYVSYLSGLDLTGMDVSVATVFPPALSDAKWNEGYVDANIATMESESGLASLSEQIRMLELPDLRTRTRMHRLFNERLTAAVTALGFRVVQDFEPFLAPTGDVIDDRFFESTQGGDHHLDWMPAGPIINRLLLEHFDRAA